VVENCNKAMERGISILQKGYLLPEVYYFKEKRLSQER